MAQTTDKLIEKVTKLSIETALEFMEKEKKRQKKEKHDRRLRNTKLMLKNYRSFVLHAKEIELEIKELEYDYDIVTLFEDNEYAIEAIKQSKKRTLVMVNFITRMLGVYKVICQQSLKPEEQRRYDIIYKMYISDKKYTVEEISECHNIEPRTVYRDVNKACESLSGLMFGVDSVRFID